MFQFPGFPTYAYVFSIRFIVLHYESFLIRKSADRSLFAAPRSFSQLVASFIGSWCQGIRPVLLFAWTILIGSCSFSLLELLEFHKQIIFWFRLLILFSEKVLSFSSNCFIPPFGEIVVIITQIGKTLIDLTNLFKLNLLLSSYLFVYYSSYSYSVFNDHNVDPF